MFASQLDMGNVRRVNNADSLWSSTNVSAMMTFATVLLYAGVLGLVVAAAVHGVGGDGVVLDFSR